MVTFTLPITQNKLARWCESIISSYLGVDVKIGNVNFNMLNRIVIDDVAIKDKNNNNFTNISRLATTFELSSFYQGKFNISSIQVFGVEFNINKQTSQSKSNCQFLLDLLNL